MNKITRFHNKRKILMKGHISWAHILNGTRCCNCCLSLQWVLEMKAWQKDQPGKKGCGERPTEDRAKIISMPPWSWYSASTFYISDTVFSKHLPFSEPLTRMGQLQVLVSVVTIPFKKQVKDYLLSKTNTLQDWTKTLRGQAVHWPGCLIVFLAGKDLLSLSWQLSRSNKV